MSRQRSLGMRDLKLAFESSNPSGWPSGRNSYTDPITGLIQFGEDPQGYVGTCAFLAAAPDNLMVWNDKNHTSTWRFYDMFGNETLITVNNYRPVADYSSPGRLGIAEKAAGKALERFGLVEPGKTAWQEITDGNAAADMLAITTGRRFTNGHVDVLTAGYLASLGAEDIIVWTGQGRELAASHGYRVTGIGANTITFYNPWLKQLNRPGAYITLSDVELQSEGSFGIAYG